MGVQYCINVKRKISPFKKSGIYKLKCPECNAVYLGQTLRKFEIRYSEHLRAYRLKQPYKAHYAKHLLDTKHSKTPGTELEVLHVYAKKLELNFLEELEIKR